MINYLYKVTTNTYSGIIVVKAKTMTDAYALLSSEFEDLSSVTITLIECTEELAFLN